MKKINFLALAIIVALIGTTSCKQVENVVSNDGLVGTWTSTGESAVVVDAGAYTAIVEAVLSNLFKMPQTLVFNQDKTGTATMSGGTTANFTYTDALGSLVVKFDKYMVSGVDIASIPLVFTYTIADNKLSLTSNITEQVKLFLSLSGLPQSELYSTVLTKAEIKGNYTK